MNFTDWINNKLKPLIDAIATAIKAAEPKRFKQSGTINGDTPIQLPTGGVSNNLIIVCQIDYVIQVEGGGYTTDALNETITILTNETNTFYDLQVIYK